MDFNYKGKVLISTPDISGDIFSRSVVLIIDHNEAGAFGLILNKRNEQLSSHVQQLFGPDTEIYEGGPVENDKIFFIVKGKPVTEHAMHLENGFYLTEDIENVMSAILEGRLLIENVKAFSGYSGWASQQLEAEVSRKAWTVVDVYNLDYTSPNDHGLWKNIMQNLGGEYLLWANAPANVSMN